MSGDILAQAERIVDAAFQQGDRNAELDRLADAILATGNRLAPARRAEYLATVITLVDCLTRLHKMMGGGQCQ